MKKNYKYFLLDLDGTISDSSPGITRAAAYALRHYGITPPEDLSKLKFFIGPPLVDTYTKFYGFDDVKAREAVSVFREYYNDKGAYENDLYEGMKDLFEEVYNAGGRLVLATSKFDEIAFRIIEYFGLTHYFTFMAGGLKASREKKGEVIEYILSELKCDPSECIMIGDREHDVIGAKQNNMDSLGVLFGFGDRAELENAGADSIVETVEELKKFMLEHIG